VTFLGPMYASSSKSVTVTSHFVSRQSLLGSEYFYHISSTAVILSSLSCFFCLLLDDVLINS
jgi:hypothetical protein